MPGSSLVPGVFPVHLKEKQQRKFEKKNMENQLRVGMESVENTYRWLAMFCSLLPALLMNIDNLIVYFEHFVYCYYCRVDQKYQL